MVDGRMKDDKMIKNEEESIKTTEKKRKKRGGKHCWRKRWNAGAGKNMEENYKESRGNEKWIKVISMTKLSMSNKRSITQAE